MYKKDDPKGWKQSSEFKKSFSIDVDIEFVGVWDTVGSVGIFPRRLPFTASNSHIRYFRHAISLDERRARFKPNLWNKSTKEDHEKGVKKGEMPRGHNMPGHSHSQDEVPQQQAEEGKDQDGEKGLSLSQAEKKYDDGDLETDIEEVWFSGAHTDVGGGSVANGTRHNLARISLRWMIREIFKLNLGIMFHKNAFTSLGLNPDTLYPKVLPRPDPIPYTTGCLAHQFEPPINKAKDYKATVSKEIEFENEEMEDMLDSLTPIYDQLKMAKFWWVLELFPTKHRFQRDDKTWAHARG